MQRVLIVKTSSMGDVVHALPAVSDMVGALPGLQVDWLVEKAFADIARRHAQVQRVIPMQWRKWRTSLREPDTWHAIRTCRKALNEQPYDAIVDLQGLLKSAWFSRYAQGTRHGYDCRSAREPLAALLYQRRHAVSRQLQAVERCRRLAAQALGYRMPDAPPDFGLRHQPGGWQPVAGGDALPAYAVLVPCASRPEKLWPQAHWVATGLRLREQGLQVAVLWGSPDEQRLAQAIAQGCGAQVPPFLSVGQVVDTMAGAALVVGLDTGMTHIAAACGRPTLGLYCDHDPGLAGVTGAAEVKSLGGKGQMPTLNDVLEVVHAWTQT
jgi:heptosyltransferase-1